MDDRLIYNTYKNWTFGADFSGEIISQDNIEDFVRKCAEIGEIHLAIASDSRDNFKDKEDKENNVFDSHFAGLVMALKVLSKGGNLIFFSYSLCNAVNINLMYFLNLVFEEVHIFKPAACAMACYEFYIIGIDFKKDELVDKFVEEMKLCAGPESWKKGKFHASINYVLIFLVFRTPLPKERYSNRVPGAAC